MAICILATANRPCLVLSSVVFHKRKMVPTEAMSGVQNVLEPSQDNGWIIHCLAHTMAEDVVHSATYYESSSIRLPVQERLAEKLASLAIIAAFKEAVGSESFWSNIPSSFSTRSLSYSNASSPSDRRKTVLHSTRQREVHMDTEMSGNGETHQFNGTIKYHSSGSSSSTLRPSKDTHSSGEVSYEERGPHGRSAKLMTYAEAISDDIITWLNNNITNIDDLCLISDQLSDKIITSLLTEVRLRGYAGRLVSDAFSPGWKELKMASVQDALVRHPTTNYAGRLVSGALSLARAELKRASLHDSLCWKAGLRCTLSG
eukprot:XP_014012075.1 PREDICTED: uncharacterized protein LOC106578045 [Salmo salar]